ncbi:MAG: hypothetical protein IKM77_08135 [Prevotella sp.]|nr:hypothetical protein [Prevotella sp.]
MKRSSIILVSIWGLVVLSFLTTQLTGDFMVFWAYAKQVQNSPNSGLSAIVDIWELKGLLFKNILYLDYILTSSFITDYSILCQTLYKFFGLVLYFSILLIAVRLLPSKYLIGNSRSILFFIVGILLLVTHFAAHFQAEMWGVVFAILALSLYLNNNLFCKIIAGIIYSLTFYLKSPIPLIGGSLFFGAMLIKEQKFKEAIKDVMPFAISSAVFLSASLFFVYKYYPQEIIDIWDASYYQHTLLHEGIGAFLGAILYLISNGSFFYALYNVTFSLGLISTIIVLVLWGSTKINKPFIILELKYKQCIILLVMWFFPLVYVALSNKYFIYHYYLLVFPAIITLYIFYRDWNKKKKHLFYLIIGLHTVYYAVFLSSIAPTNLYIKDYYSKMWEDNKTKKGIYVGCKIGNGEILYLDAGSGAFTFNNKSYLRYFYPLPLQRIDAEDPFTETDTYKKVKQKVMDYQGEYITISPDWFFAHENNNDIKKKIENEYELYDVIDVPYIPWNVFHFEKDVDHLSIYRRLKQ